MINIVKKMIVFLLPLASLSTLAYGQDVPAVTGPPSSPGVFSLPDTAGTFRFSLTGTQGVRTGYARTGHNIWTTDISGNAAYLSGSAARPFSLIYSGGYLYNTAGQPGSVFQNLELSQSLTTEYWDFALSDSVNYLPESPSGGLSGLQGLGDVGVNPPPLDPSTGQDVLSNYAQRVGNTTTGHVERKLTGSTSLKGSGTYFIQRFLATSGGIDINQVSGGAGVTHRINALSNIGGNYTYSRFTYPSVADFSFTSQGFNFTYSRQWTRQFNMTTSAGPQISTTPPISVGTFVQPGNSLVNFSADIAFDYTTERASASISYSRGVRGGSGVVAGSLSDSVGLQASRKFGRYLQISADVGYNHIKELEILTTTPTTFQNFNGSVQASRTIAENFSAYISYTIQKQIMDGSGAPVNAFNGLSNTGTIGITYSPRALHVGHP